MTAQIVKQFSQAQVSYLAGVFDTRGNFGTNTARGRIQLKSQDLRLLQYVQTLTGGAIYRAAGRSHQLVIPRAQAPRILEQLVGQLVVKKAVAQRLLLSN